MVSGEWRVGKLSLRELGKVIHAIGTFKELFNHSSDSIIGGKYAVEFMK